MSERLYRVQRGRDGSGPWYSLGGLRWTADELTGTSVARLPMPTIDGFPEGWKSASRSLDYLASRFSIRDLEALSKARFELVIVEAPADAVTEVDGHVAFDPRLSPIVERRSVFYLRGKA